ncbi:5397_t:CDS:2 [Paraglomus brasilianum]|uniref:5397_t:CDS:1 n=1 Tax=Paraglomus brasilianum TaxID=144538 RepID=A0A9N9BXD5_9GLOM|nr:5397_t:CDS:2 [Paraglomus brasilianum]
MRGNKGRKNYHYQRLALGHDKEFATVVYSQNFYFAKPMRDMPSSPGVAPGETTMLPNHYHQVQRCQLMWKAWGIVKILLVPGMVPASSNIT